MPPDWIRYVEDIAKTANAIAERVQRLSPEGFAGDRAARAAVARDLERIAGATRQVPDEVRARFPQVPWVELAAIGTALTQDSADVDVRFPWKTVGVDLPAILPALRRIILLELPWIFSIPDLHEFPEGSLPSPYGLMSPVRRLPAGSRLVAVGWLDGPIEFTKGASPPEVVSRLLSLDEVFLIDEGTRGYHGCYYCDPSAFERSPGFGDGRITPRGTYPYCDRPHSPESKGHHLVRLDGVVYMCPALLPHYILAHGYRPPDVFQEAVLRGTFLADDDLVHTESVT